MKLRNKNKFRYGILAYTGPFQELSIRYGNLSFLNGILIYATHQNCENYFHCKNQHVYEVATSQKDLHMFQVSCMIYMDKISFTNVDNDTVKYWVGGKL
jgi:hypothetical protein